MIAVSDTYMRTPWVIRWERIIMVCAHFFKGKKKIIFDSKTDFSPVSFYFGRCREEVGTVRVWLSETYKLIPGLEITTKVEICN